MLAKLVLRVRSWFRRGAERPAACPPHGCGLVVRSGPGPEISFRLPEVRGARVEVLRTDGRRLLSMDVARTASHLPLPGDLPAGEYLVLVQGGASRFVAPLAVSR